MLITKFKTEFQMTKIIITYFSNFKEFKNFKVQLDFKLQYK